MKTKAITIQSQKECQKIEFTGDKSIKFIREQTYVIDANAALLGAPSQNTQGTIRSVVRVTASFEQNGKVELRSVDLDLPIDMIILGEMRECISALEIALEKYSAKLPHPKTVEITVNTAPDGTTKTDTISLGYRIQKKGEIISTFRFETKTGNAYLEGVNSEEINRFYLGLQSLV